MHDDVAKPVFGDRSAQVMREILSRFERIDAAAGANRHCHEDGKPADIGADVEDIHAFFTCRLTKAVSAGL